LFARDTNSGESEPSGGITMSVRLPKAIEFFMSSENAHDADALAACFAPDATVRDEGRTRRGLTEIAAWRRETTEKYHHTVEPVAVAERDGKTIVATKLSGKFPGSPITLDFVFKLKDDKISSLEIQS
jgi:SnoaL-like domain